MSYMQLQKFRTHKFLFFVLLPLAVAVLSSCARQGQSQTALESVVTGEDAGQAAPVVTAVLAKAEKTLPYPARDDLDKLDAVLQGLSPKARAVMPLNSSNRAEFLTIWSRSLRKRRASAGTTFPSSI